MITGQQVTQVHAKYIHLCSFMNYANKSVLFCVLIAFKGDLWEGAGLRGLGVPAHPIKVLSVLVMGHSGRPASLCLVPLLGRAGAEEAGGGGEATVPPASHPGCRVHPGPSGSIRPIGPQGGVSTLPFPKPFQPHLPYLLKQPISSPS